MSYLSRLKQLSGDEEFTHRPRPELTELTKAPFGGFVGMGPGCIEKITAANSQIVGADDTAANSMTANDENAIRAWLALIDETDLATIADVLKRCQQDTEARDYFTGRAAAELPKADPFPDDRRTCTRCLNLRQGVCSVAKPEAGALVVASRGYRPVNLALRCAGFSPKPSDTDQRIGAEQWPGLIHQCPA